MILWQKNVHLLVSSFASVICINLKIFLTVLDLCCCTWAFSRFGEWGLFSSCGAWTSHCSGFSCCGAWALEHAVFSSCDTWAYLPCRMWNLSGPKIKPMSPGIGRQILNHWTTREVPMILSMETFRSPKTTYVSLNNIGESLKRYFPILILGTFIWPPQFWLMYMRR